MNKDLYIYLAGSLSYLKRQDKFDIATEWRDEIDRWAIDNGVKTFNPAITFSKEINHGYSDSLIVRQNEFFLNKTTIMIVQLDYIDWSPGTVFEMATYKHMNKPVIAFGSETIWSPHIKECISQHCDNIEDVIEVLTNMFL